MTASSSPLAFCPVLEEMVVSGFAIGQSGKRISTSSISTTNNILTLRAIHFATRAKSTLEIGFRFAGSGLVFTQTHKDLGAEPARQHVGIDPHQRAPFNNSTGLLAVGRAGLDGWLDLREDFSCNVLPALAREGRSFDMIYIDGSHNFEDVFVDMYYSARLARAGGIILFDDSQHPHIAKVLKFVRRNCRDSLQEMTLVEYRSDRSLKYRLAAALRRTQLTAFRKVQEMDRPLSYELSRF